MKHLRGTLDLIISTVDVAEGFPLRDYLKQADIESIMEALLIG
jgi:hypothetical protein